MGVGSRPTRNFRSFLRRTPFGGGGGSGRIFFPVAAGKDQSNSLNSGRFVYISGGPGDHPPFLETHGNSGTLGRSAYTFKERNHINSMEKKTFTKSLGGGHGPRGLPGYATAFLVAFTSRYPGSFLQVM